MLQETRGKCEMAAAMVISGSIGYFVMLSAATPINVVFWRCVFGALTLMVICIFCGVFRHAKITRRVLWLSAFGGVAIVLNWVLLFAAFSRASISVATAVYNTQPFMLMVFGAAFLGERLTVSKLAWMLLAFIGVVLIVQARPSADYVGNDFALGVASALCAAFFWAIAAIITKKLTGTPAYLIAFIQVCVGMLMLGPFVDFANAPRSVSHWLPLITIGVLHTGIMYILLYSGIQKLPTHLQGAFTFIYPVVAIVIDRVALGHQLQLIQMIGITAILIGAAGLNIRWLPRNRSGQS
jgi:drug/metabolite transporter (DMT)-like permease